MADGTQNKKKSTTVRIWTDPKKRLQDVVREKAARERRDVTEIELVSMAVDAFCKKEEKRLGI
jgi:hypothetical protein